MVTNPTNAYRRMSTLHYKHSIPPTCFGQSFGHPHGGALQRIFYRCFWNNAQM